MTVGNILVEGMVATSTALRGQGEPPSLYTADDSVCEKAKEMHVQTVQKPFTIAQLREALKAVARVE
jgi:hypothetical protein